MSQVYIIHGGDFFDSRKEFVASLKKEKVTKDDFLFSDKKKWKDNLALDLADEYEVFAPKMPLKDDARYDEWKIWFEKSFPYLKNNIILIGHSLGGIFLLRYLSENTFPKKIKGVFFVAAPNWKRIKLDTEKGGFTYKSLEKLAKQVKNIFILHSKDDPVVEFSHGVSLSKTLPQATFAIFSDQKHFSSETFPEIEEYIRGL